MNILVFKNCNFILDFVTCFRSIQWLCNYQGFRTPWWWRRLRGRNMLEWLISNKLSIINLCISLVYFCLHYWKCTVQKTKFLCYFTYIDDARWNTSQINCCSCSSPDISPGLLLYFTAKCIIFIVPLFHTMWWL